MGYPGNEKAGKRHSDASPSGGSAARHERSETEYAVHLYLSKLVKLVRVSQAIELGYTHT